MRITIRAWGDYACFTRPELKAERVSYEVITPSAARGILDSIYWKPEFFWVVEQIKVMRKPKFIPFARNEVKSGIKFNRSGFVSAPYFNTKDTDNRLCRSGQILKDVEYYITARPHCFDVPPKDGNPNTPKKHHDIFTRRASLGGFYRLPYFGCSEYRANFELVSDALLPQSEFRGSYDLGRMFYDFDYRGLKATPPVSPQPRFFEAKLVDGVMDIPNLIY